MADSTDRREQSIDLRVKFDPVVFFNTLFSAKPIDPPKVIRADIQKLFGNQSKDELLQILNKIADYVDTSSEDPAVILNIQELLGQKKH